jgi:hypothetical protein
MYKMGSPDLPEPAVARPQNLNTLVAALRRIRRPRHANVRVQYT